MLLRFVLGFGLCSSLANSDLLIRNVTIVDVSSGTAARHRSVLILKDRISAIGSVIHAGAHTRIIDGSGKFVIPGLWDMHVHLTAREQLPLYVAWGITGVRDMGSDFDRVNVWREQIQRGELLGPHIETCGPAIDGIPSSDPKLPVRVVRTPTEARAVFDQLDSESVDFIGILPHLPRDAYFALLERARKYYTAVAGDVADSVSALEAVEARQRSIEHMSGVVLAPNAEALFQRMALFETRFVPALAELRCGRSAEILLKMKRAGVAIMAGSDGGNPGESLHEELELLVAAGFSPAQALRSATLEPARYLNAESLGGVEQGKNADLVMLDADPLSDIRNTRKIAAVVLAGKYHLVRKRSLTVAVLKEGPGF